MFRKTFRIWTKNCKILFVVSPFWLSALNILPGLNASVDGWILWDMVLLLMKYCRCSRCWCRNVVDVVVYQMLSLRLLLMSRLLLLAFGASFIARLFLLRVLRDGFNGASDDREVYSVHKKLIEAPTFAGLQSINFLIKNPLLYYSQICEQNQTNSASVEQLTKKLSSWVFGRELDDLSVGDNALSHVIKTKTNKLCIYLLSDWVSNLIDWKTI